jgi:diguanylate cyclase (GGDEF)-like protein
VKLVSGYVVRRQVPSRQEVWMGAGLVTALAVVMACTLWALHLPAHTTALAFLIVALAMAANVVLFFLPWERLSTQVPLLVFPLLLLDTLLALALLNHEMAANYTGFLTLAFIFIGLTQVRGVSVGFVALSVPVWILCQVGQKSSVGVRLPMVVVIWILIGEVLSRHTALSRARAGELVAQASNDTLTGLPSRRVLAEHVNRAIVDDDRRPASLLVLDLDGFKAINDAYGHVVGDELLVEIARRISTSVTDNDLVARLGGDEFAISLEACGADSATKVAQRIIDAVAGPVGLSKGNVAVTASVGIFEIADCDSADDAIRNADMAMYRAKLTGKNRLAIYEKGLRAETDERFELEAELRTALEEHQFTAHYQPVVRVLGNDIVGFESLVRWDHPRRGLLAAGAFIEVCEDAGLIAALGTWMLNEACQQARAWEIRYPERQAFMAVNLSSRQLLDADLVGEVRAALDLSGLSGSSLVLEITERVLLVDSPFVIRQLDELTALGVRIAVDDFGTGYSSLAYLRHFPIDILKIDKSFVDAIDTDPQAVALARSIVGIADALHLEVIAEGAETAAQVDALLAIGCSIVQGYFFGKPTSPADLGMCLSNLAPATAPSRLPVKYGVST